MKRRHLVMCIFAIAALAGVACGQAGGKTEASVAPPAAAASSAAATAHPAEVAAAPAASTPAASGAAEFPVPPMTAATSSSAGATSPAGTAGTTPAAGAAAAAAAGSAPDTPEMVRRRAQIQWALRQDEIKNDPHGQWAASASASSSYNDAKGTAAHAPSQATGSPNVETYTNSIEAWAPKTANGGIEWLELTFATPVHATSVRIRESYGAGAVIKVDVFDEQNTPHTVWNGVDPTKDLDYLTVVFPRTAFKTARVKVTLATNAVPGFKQIDAVQLVGTEQ
jgi:hypothetical protein